MGSHNTAFKVSYRIAEKHRVRGPWVFEQAANIGAGSKLASLTSPGEQATTW